MSTPVANGIARAIDFIEQGWIQDSDAMSIRGREVDPCSKSAVCWCMSGAVMRAFNIRALDNNYESVKFEHKSKADDLIEDVIAYRYRDGQYPRFASYIEFNDSDRASQVRVISVLKAAQARAEKLGI